MKRHPMVAMVWFIILIFFVSIACTILTGKEEATETPAPQVVEPVEPAVEEPVEEPVVEPEEPASAAVSTFRDAQMAVIQIESQGTFVDPEFGEYSGAGYGSGFIIDPAGIAVTNNHVVTGAAKLQIWIGGDTSKSYNARVLGVSECSDLAVIDIDGEGFAYLEWYDLPVEVGLEVYTAGFPLGEPDYTLTKGIISKENASGESNWASVKSVIMHDATINPGNSGGPLIDANGKVVGINYRARKAQDQYFAISKDIAIPIVNQLRNGENIDFVGINGTAVTSTDGAISGIWVSSVASGSPADRAGLTGGDIVLELEGLKLATDGTMADYCDIIRSHVPQDTLGLGVLRYPTSEYLEGQLNGRVLSVVDNPSFSVSDVTETPTETVIPTETPLLPTATKAAAPSYFVIDNWCLSHQGCVSVDVRNNSGMNSTWHIWNTDFGVDSTFTVYPGPATVVSRPGKYNFYITYCSGEVSQFQWQLNNNWFYKIDPCG